MERYMQAKTNRREGRRATYAMMMAELNTYLEVCAARNGFHSIRSIETNGAIQVLTGKYEAPEVAKFKKRA